MAEFSVEHTCGHVVQHRFEGPNHQRARREHWLRSKPCQTCWHDAQNATSAEESRNLGLPPLQGEPEVVAWAEVIRSKAVANNLDFHQRINRPRTGPSPDETTAAAIRAATDRAIDHLKRQDSAEWWIEHRFDVVSHVRNAAIDAVARLNEKPADSD